MKASLRRYRWWLLAACLGLAVIAWRFWPGVRLARSQYDQIKLGMTIADVTKILGRLPGDYSWGRRPPAWIVVDGPHVLPGDWMPMPESDRMKPGEFRILFWATSEEICKVRTYDGLVIAKQFGVAYSSVEEQIRSWLMWLARPFELVSDGTIALKLPP